MIKTSEFKEEHNDELVKFSSVPIQNELLNITSEHIYSEDTFEGKFQDKISPSDQSFEQPEEYLTPIEKYLEEFNKFYTNMKSMNKTIADMLEELIDTSVKKNEQDDKITEFSSK